MGNCCGSPSESAAQREAAQSQPPIVELVKQRRRKIRAALAKQRKRLKVSTSSASVSSELQPDHNSDVSGGAPTEEPTRTVHVEARADLPHDADDPPQCEVENPLGSRKKLSVGSTSASESAATSSYDDCISFADGATGVQNWLVGVPTSPSNGSSPSFNMEILWGSFEVGSDEELDRLAEGRGYSSGLHAAEPSDGCSWWQAYVEPSIETTTTPHPTSSPNFGAQAEQPCAEAFRLGEF